MSEAQNSRWTNLRRSAYEWIAMASALLAFVCLLDLVIAACGPWGDSQSLGGPSNIVGCVKRGSIFLRSGLNDSVWSWTLSPTSQAMARVDVLSDRRLSVPGFHCRILRYSFNSGAMGGGQVPGTAWGLEMSLFIPFVVSGLLAIACFRRYRALFAGHLFPKIQLQPDTRETRPLS